MKYKYLKVQGLLILFVLLSVSCSTDLSEDFGTDEAGSAPVAFKPGNPTGEGVCVYQAGVFTDFDPDLGQFPEGIAMDNAGNLYVGFAPTGQIVQLDCEGGILRTVAGFNGLNLELPNLLGLTTDSQGYIYAALNDLDGAAPDLNGVWRIDPNGMVGANTYRIPGSEAILFPNALVFDDRGNLFVTSSLTGSVWKISDNGDVAPWVQDETLFGQENPFVPPLGANGITYFDNHLFVANSTKKQIVKIPITASGAPGIPAVLTSFALVPGSPDPNVPFGGLDGITVDPEGNLYVALTADQKIVKVSPDGLTKTDATPPNSKVLFPASLIFGKTRGIEKSLFITNFNVEGFGIDPVPGVVKSPVGISGK